MSPAKREREQSGFPDRSRFMAQPAKIYRRPWSRQPPLDAFWLRDATNSQPT